MTILGQHNPTPDMLRGLGPEREALAMLKKNRKVHASLDYAEQSSHVAVPTKQRNDSSQYQEISPINSKRPLALSHMNSSLARPELSWKNSINLERKNKSLIDQAMSELNIKNFIKK